METLTRPMDPNKTHGPLYIKGILVGRTVHRIDALKLLGLIPSSIFRSRHPKPAVSHEVFGRLVQYRALLFGLSPCLSTTTETHLNRTRKAKRRLSTFARTLSSTPKSETTAPPSRQARPVRWQPHPIGDRVGGVPQQRRT